MIRQRAVLRNSSGSSGYHHDELSKQRVAAQPPGDGRKPSIPPVNYYYFAVHWVCFLIVVYGVMLNHQKLYTSEECDMTWSRRQFLLLDLESNTTLDPQRSSIHEYPPSYRFFKFIDQRDVRYKSLQSKEVLRSSDSHIWCNPQSSNYNIPIVVFVPGHGGSYEQSRSLGAHGTQLSRSDYSGTPHEYLVNQKLQRRMTNSDEGIPEIDDFFFDVYALDFGEEGGALHGLLVERQASYISDRINTLSAVCNVTQIHVVAHSMGGVSSRLALVQYPEFMKVVRNLITLGTPHNSPLWNWETTMFNIYNKLYKRSGPLKASIISISGGVRDEMIPPDSCYIVNERVGNSTISVLASSIMQPATIEGKTVAPLLGMDHRAIVWCHNVLSEVRSILYNLIHVNNISTQLKLSSPGFPDNYGESTTRLGHSMKEMYGYWESMLMITSQLYNTEILVKLFACLGTWHYLGFISSNDRVALSIFLPPIVASIFYFGMTFGGIKKDLLRMESIVILSYVADGIFRFVRFLLCRLKKGELRSQILVSHWNRGKKVILLIWPLLYLTAYLLFGGRTWLQPEFVLGVTLILTVLYLAFLSIYLLPKDAPLPSRLACDREVNFVAWMILLLPFVATGALYAVLKGFHSWSHCKMLIPIALRFALAIQVFPKSIASPNLTKVDSEISRRVMRLLRVVTMAFGCWNLFAFHVHDEILMHPLPALIMTATICDIAEFIERPRRHDSKIR